MIRKSERRVGVVLAIAASLLATAAIAATPAPRAPQAARDAAMQQLQKPGGVGGCVFLAVPVGARQAALEQILAGKPGSPPALQTAVAQVAPKCTGKPYSNTDAALIMTVTATFRRASAAVFFAQQHGVGQTKLDAAWRAATPQQKAPFAAMAAEAMAPGDKVTSRQLDVTPMARAAGIAAPLDRQTEGLLRAYFVSGLIIEKAEAALKARGAKPAA